MDIYPQIVDMGSQYLCGFSINSDSAGIRQLGFVFMRPAVNKTIAVNSFDAAEVGIPVATSYSNQEDNCYRAYPATYDDTQSVAKTQTCDSLH